MRSILASRTFEDRDQQWFAALSGDVNPMHMDARGAAATQAGEPVVHGVHAVLWALEQLAARGWDVAGARQIKVKFSKFITLGKTASLVVTGDGAQGLRAEIDVPGAQGAVSLRLNAAAPASREPQPQPLPPCDGPRPDLSRGPIVRDVGDFADAHGRLDAPAGAAAQASAAFPALATSWSARTLVNMALMSTVVGMVTPGLHSIFSDFTLTFTGSALDDGAAPGLAFATSTVDPRFRLVAIQAGCAEFRAAISAYLRYPPVKPPRFEEIEAVIAPDQFAGRRALIVGASRGIGAVAAQAVAAGGGDVVATYAANRNAAREIQAAARARRPGAAFDILPYDVTAATPLPEPQTFTDLYYFATPRIFDQGGEVFSAARFEAFCRVYVTGFHDIVMALLDRRGTPLRVFYPSSVAVQERPKNMTEYAMAKSAGEILCADLMKAHPLLDIAAHRLPRILTDQTATVPPVAAPSALAALAPLLAPGRQPTSNGPDRRDGSP